MYITSTMSTSDTRSRSNAVAKRLLQRLIEVDLHHAYLNVNNFDGIVNQIAVIYELISPFLVGVVPTSDFQSSGCERRNLSRSSIFFIFSQQIGRHQHRTCFSVTYMACSLTSLRRHKHPGIRPATDAIGFSESYEP